MLRRLRLNGKCVDHNHIRNIGHQPDNPPTSFTQSSRQALTRKSRQDNAVKSRGWSVLRTTSRRQLSPRLEQNRVVRVLYSTIQARETRPLESRWAGLTSPPESSNPACRWGPKRMWRAPTWRSRPEYAQAALMTRFR